MVNVPRRAFRHKTIANTAPIAAYCLVSITFVCCAKADGGFETPRCKETVARIVAEAGASFDHLAPSGDNVFLRHPAARDIVLSCASYRPLSLSIGWRDGFPPSAYYDLLGRAGAVVTAATAAALSKATRACQVAALKSSDENVEQTIPGAALDCTAFTRDGGGTLIDMRSPPAE